MKEGEWLSFKKCIRNLFLANFLLLFAFTLLPVLLLFPDLEIWKTSVNYLTK